MTVLGSTLPAYAALEAQAGDRKPGTAATPTVTLAEDDPVDDESPAEQAAMAPAPARRSVDENAIRLCLFMIGTPQVLSGVARLLPNGSAATASSSHAGLRGGSENARGEAETSSPARRDCQQGARVATLLNRSFAVDANSADTVE
jgi:hypothetical protein